jgi:outer membrane protein
MKTPLLAIAWLVVGSIAFATQAEAQLKLGTIDMQKVLVGYYKTQEAEAKLQEAQKAYKDELDQRMDTYKKNLDAINKLNEELNKPDISGAAKDQKAQERDSKIAETKGLEKEISDFRAIREKQIQEQFTHMRAGLIEEIMKVVAEQVKTQNYDLVFDKSGQSYNTAVPVLVYAKDNFDFSEAVITKLNANRPAATPSAQKTEKKDEKTEKKEATPSGTNTPATTTKPGGFPSPSKKP